MWFIFAMLSAVFAALTSILAKIRHRRCQLKSCNGNQNSGGCRYGMGDGFYYKCSGRHI